MGDTVAQSAGASKPGKASMTMKIAKRDLVVLALLVVAGGVGAGFFKLSQAKAEYERSRAEINQHVLTFAPMGEADFAVLSPAATEWQVRHDEVDSVEGQSLVLLGREPTVTNLVDIYCTPLPEYSLTDWDRNAREARRGVVMATILSATEDGAIYVSDDGGTALLWLTEHLVMVYRDEDGGLRATQLLRATGNGDSADHATMEADADPPIEPDTPTSVPVEADK